MRVGLWEGEEYRRWNEEELSSVERRNEGLGSKKKKEKKSESEDKRARAKEEKREGKEKFVDPSAGTSQEVEAESERAAWLPGPHYEKVALFIVEKYVALIKAMYTLPYI